MTHDYKRHGTTTLFAAMELAQGKVVGECYQRHRHQEFLKFLRRLDREFPGPLALHLVMDNYGTHSEEEVRAWLKKHPRFRLHFVPTSFQLAELGRTLVSGAVGAVRSPGCVLQRRRAATRHPRFSRCLE
jgi:hypothetical protein